MASRTEVHRWGDLELRTEMLHLGTRSQGSIGRLLRGGVEVVGEQVGQVIEVTDADGRSIRVRYAGSERPNLWTRSGWVLEGPDLAASPQVDSPRGAMAALRAALRRRRRR